MKTVSEIRELKVNRYLIIDDEPCKIVNMSTSKPGKHGTAKARIEAVGVFDGQKRSYTAPVTDKVHVPIIDKRQGQVISVSGNHAQLMDMETYDTFDIAVPDEYKGQLEAGQDVQYLEAMGRRKITRA